MAQQRPMAWQHRENSMAERVRTVEHDPAGGWIARDPATGKELEENWRWNTRESARDAVWQFQNLPPARGVAEFCRFPDCKCPMDPGPQPDWCAKGLPHASGVGGPDGETFSPRGTHGGGKP